MTAEEMWKACGLKGPANAWQFGDDPDGLALLVLRGRKRATASAYPLYALEGEELPRAGECGVILNSRNEAVCVIRTERVFVTPFCRVDGRQAYLEGEGDRTLEDWRRTHRRFFEAEMAAAGLEFTEDMPVVCEEFTVIYPGREAEDEG